MSNKAPVDPKKTREMQERTKERNSILQAIKSHGPATIEELSKTTGLEKTTLVKHLIAMKQFGKVSIVGQRNNEFIYGLPSGSEQSCV